MHRFPIASLAFQPVNSSAERLNEVIRKSASVVNTPQDTASSTALNKLASKFSVESIIYLSTLTFSFLDGDIPLFRAVVDTDNGEPVISIEFKVDLHRRRELPFALLPQTKHNLPLPSHIGGLQFG